MSGPLSDLTEREAMELAYGLLWLAPVDTHTKAGRLTRDARLALGNSLGFEGKKAGIQRGQVMLEGLRKKDRSLGASRPSIDTEEYSE